MLRVSAGSSAVLRATIYALRAMPRELQGQIRRHTKEMIVPEFEKAMNEHANTPLEFAALVATARATVSNQNIKLSAGSVGRPLAGGLLPKRDAHAVEFGGDHNARATYRARSRKGTSYSVTRRTRAQLRPRRRSGYVFFPAVAHIAPRVLALWVQTAVRTISEALEGKNG